MSYIKNLEKAWSIGHSIKSKAGSSSLSDADYYLEVVAGVNSGALRHNFRSCVQYQDVLEHVSYPLAIEYLRKLEAWEHFPILLESQLNRDFSNLGNPPVYKFRTKGSLQILNPTFVRYAYVARDLISRLGNLGGTKVAEIGVGFGGQTAVLNKVASLESAYLYDLPEVNELAKWFLGQVAPNFEAVCRDGRNPKPVYVDLIISNFAFSELSRSVQEQYMVNVIQRAEHGYILWNRLSETKLDGMTAEEFGERIPNAKIEPETPSSYKGNVLISW